MERGSCCSNGCKNCPYELDVVQLYEKDGCLYCPGNASSRDEWVKEPVILLYENPTTYLANGEVYREGGDHDTISWPNADKGKLRRALFDLRERGWIPDRDKFVRLPDGSLQPF